MKTTLSAKGHIVLPMEIRERVALHPGAEIEVTEKNGEIILTPLEKGRNEGLVDTLLNCPAGRLYLPRRKKEFARQPPKF